MADEKSISGRFSPAPRSSAAWEFHQIVFCVWAFPVIFEMEDELVITLLREKTVYAGDVRTTIDQGIVRLLQYLVWINDTQINESLE